MHLSAHVLECNYKKYAVLNEQVLAKHIAFRLFILLVGILQNLSWAVFVA